MRRLTSIDLHGAKFTNGCMKDTRYCLIQKSEAYTMLAGRLDCRSQVGWAGWILKYVLIWSYLPIHTLIAFEH